MEKLSFVIPCYGSEKTLVSVVNEIKTIVNRMDNYDYELILVNDQSIDDTYSVIQELCSLDTKIKGIDLSKNFGQHAATMAGFNFVSGDIVVTVDDDGQLPVDKLNEFLIKLNEGFDIVIGQYGLTKSSSFRRFGSTINDYMAQLLINKPRNLQLTSFMVIRRYIVNDMIKYKSAFPYLPGLLLRSSNRITNVLVEHRERNVGKSGYTFTKLIGLWMNGFTAFSVKPLRIASVIGGLSAFGGFILGGSTIVNKFANPNMPLGYSSIMSALLFIGGMLMIMIGLVGEYVGRIYISINNAPQYVIRDKLNV